MPRGDNSVVINLTTELKVFIDKHKGDLERSFYIISEFLCFHAREFIKDYGEQAYETHMDRYTKTAIQLRNEAQLEQRAELERKQKELELKERELNLKEQNANSYSQQTAQTVEKKRMENLLNVMRANKNKRTIEEKKAWQQAHDELERLRGKT